MLIFLQRTGRGENQNTRSNPGLCRSRGNGLFSRDRFGIDENNRTLMSEALATREVEGRGGGELCSP
jgi:predicted restriction endonuclease